VLGITLAGLGWAIVPFLDDPQGRGRRARVWTWVGIIAIVYVLVFTWLTYRDVKR